MRSYQPRIVSFEGHGGIGADEMYNCHSRLLSNDLDVKAHSVGVGCSDAQIDCFKDLMKNQESATLLKIASAFKRQSITSFVKWLKIGFMFTTPILGLSLKLVNDFWLVSEAGVAFLTSFQSTIIGFFITIIGPCLVLAGETL